MFSVNAVNILNKSQDVYLSYAPAQTQNPLPSYDFSIGNNNEQINVSLVYKVLAYTKDASSRTSDNFKSILKDAMVGGLNDQEKYLLYLLEKDPDGLGTSQIKVKNKNGDNDTSLLDTTPTMEYLTDLSMAEQRDFELRELMKYYRKMDEMRGILPLNEMYNQFSGTNIQLSNFHVSDFERLNDLRIHSPNF